MLSLRSISLPNDSALQKNAVIRHPLMSDNLIINPYSTPFVSSCKSIRSRRPCVFQGRRYRALYPKVPSALIGAARNSIRTSQNSNIFYSKLLRKKTSQGGVEPESNPARTTVNKAKMRPPQTLCTFKVEGAERSLRSINPRQMSQIRVSFSPYGTLLASAFGLFRRIVRIWFGGSENKELPVKQLTGNSYYFRAVILRQYFMDYSLGNFGIGSCFDELRLYIFHRRAALQGIL
jgi:hypothetical protein